MIVRISPLARALRPLVDTKLEIKCVGRTESGGYIIPNSQLKLVGLPAAPKSWGCAVDTNGKRWRDCTAIKGLFIQA